MGQPKQVIVDRCSKCYSSPKAYKMEQNQATMRLLSEYQTAYKVWPWQPARQSLKPENNKGNQNGVKRVKGHMERKSTYGIDYVPIPNPKKAGQKKPKAELACPTINLDASPSYILELFAKVEKGKKDCSKKKENDNTLMAPKHIPFHADSIYTASYHANDPETMAQCRRSTIKQKDNIEIPPSSASEKNAQSTAMGDFIRHENLGSPTANRPQGNNQLSSEPVQKSIDNKERFYQKKSFPHLCKTIIPEKGAIPMEIVSTAMADFTWPEGFEPQKQCHPPKSNNSISAKFDGTTTFNMAYKPWTAIPYELPIWARKPPYKRVRGGMTLDSLYRHDYTYPKVINPPKPIKPQSNQQNPIIKEADKDTTLIGSTYDTDFKPWDASHPPEPYFVIEVYTPPKENMDFETIYCSHYKGEYSSKRKPCRHVSQHRELDKDPKTSFLTTYNENFLNPRPKSCSSVVSSMHVAQESQSRCGSASSFIPIPKPNLELASGTNVNTSAQSSRQTKTIKSNNLKVHTQTKDQPIVITKLHRRKVC